jgi:hypothetical protein
MFKRPRAVWCALVLLLVSLSGGRSSAQEAPSLEVLLTRGGTYVLQFVAQFSNVVAQEQYLQTWRGFRRQLNSDFLMIQPKDAPGYFAFRDVLQVDGKPVRGGERLMKLLLEPSENTFERASQISAEGARYTFGNLFSSPIDVLIFIQPTFQSRFRFTLGSLDTSLGPNVWEIGFSETTRPTVLRSPRNTDVLANGRFWIEADTGRIAKTELTIGNTSVVTSYQFDERFKINVPVEMISRYRYQNYTVFGTATYGRFRRFGVTTEENIAK